MSSDENYGPSGSYNERARRGLEATANVRHRALSTLCFSLGEGNGAWSELSVEGPGIKPVSSVSFGLAGVASG